MVALQREHIHLSDSKNSLVWDKSLDGRYSPKAGYIFICDEILIIKSNGGGKASRNFFVQQKKSYSAGLFF